MKTMLVEKMITLLCIVFIGTVLFNACSTFSFKPTKEILRERIDAMMTARMNGDWETVYTYLDPSYRKKTPEKTYLGFKRGMDISKFSITSISIDPSEEEATVIIKYDIRVQMFTFENQTETQQWVKKGFNWYYKSE